VCAIVDANVIGDFFSEKTRRRFSPLLDWLETKGGCVVFGGRNKQELARSPRMLTLLAEWKRSGRAREIEEGNVLAEERRITGKCRSDDPHVIALARVSGAQILVLSKDRLLERDFQNPVLVNKPRGRIYKNASHRALLRHDSSCEPGRTRQPRRRGRTARLR
jgi:hypothetical protein